MTSSLLYLQYCQLNPLHKAAKQLALSSSLLQLKLLPPTATTNFVKPYKNLNINDNNCTYRQNRCYSGSASNNSCVGEDKQILRSPDIVAWEYADLNLTDKISEELGHVRIRQHVNPLKTSLSVPVQVQNWKDVFRDPTLPLMVDLGSGSGRFLLWLAKRDRDSFNYLGLEIRQKLVKRAEYWVEDLTLHNIHFLFANATVSFQQLVRSYPGPLMLVSILCPDPHFKRRYHKRRVVQKPLVDSIVDNLVPGGKVFVQSDVHEVARDMRDQFDRRSDKLQHVDDTDLSISCDDYGWLLSNPMGIRTEREIHAEFEGAKIYRRLYIRRA